MTLLFHTTEKRMYSGHSTNLYCSLLTEDQWTHALLHKDSDG